MMTIREWDERYRGGSGPDASPAALILDFATSLSPGKALDLACGTGRNAAYLAGLGWNVTAVDGSRAAIQILESRATGAHAVVADLERQEYVIEPGTWDLVLACYYLQRDLIHDMKAGVRRGGTLISIVHTPSPGEEPNYKRASPGELSGWFQDWEIVHYYEGPSRDPEHRRAVAEIVAIRV